MKRLTKNQIERLEQAAESLLNERGWPFDSRFSCSAVEEFCGELIKFRYANRVGVDTIDSYFPDAELAPARGSVEHFEQQLARSLAVLMFIEANK